MGLCRIDVRLVSGRAAVSPRFPHDRWNENPYLVACDVISVSSPLHFNRVQRLSMNAWGLKVKSLSGARCRRRDRSSAQKWSVVTSNSVGQTASFDRDVWTSWLKDKEAVELLGLLSVSMEMRENKARLRPWRKFDLLHFMKIRHQTPFTPRVTRVKMKFNNGESMFTALFQTVLLSLANCIVLAMQGAAKSTSALKEMFHLKYNAT